MPYSYKLYTLIYNQNHAHYFVVCMLLQHKMPAGRKRKKLDICKECSKAARPAISAAKLGHANCLTTAYRELGVFNERDDYGATPIHYASRNGKLDCLIWLLTRSGISPNAASRNGATAAHDAAAMGHLDCLEYLLKNTRCSHKDTTVEGATVLHMACRFGRLEVVKWLMEFTGSSPSEKGANDVTPVHLCAAKNHLACLKWLTTHPNYIPNGRTVHGATAVYFAAQEGSSKCLEWLIEHASGDPYLTATDGMGPVHAAAQAGQIACLQYLVDQAGVSPRHKAEDGATPAHFAAASGEVECLEWILDHGGSVHDRDQLGGTPVHDAAEQGHMSALSALIRRGVNVNMEDYDGLKPMDLAKENNHEQCARLLFKAIKPSLLLSLTPHHSLSRASATSDDEEQTQLRAEKQRQFEEALLTGASEGRQEAMWQSAQQRALPFLPPQPTDLQPGLRLLLDGEPAASASQYSLDRVPSAPQSRRHSRQSSRRSSLASKKSSISGAGDFKENLTQYKPRPALTPSLFQQPSENDFTPTPKKPRTDERDKSPMETLTPIQDHPRQPSPIPHRAKFLKKFQAVSPHPPWVKETKKMEKEGKKKPIKHPPIAKPKTGTEKESETRMAKERPTSAVNGEPMDTEPAKTEQRPTSEQERTPGEKLSPYEVAADMVVERAVMESIGPPGGVVAKKPGLLATEPQATQEQREKPTCTSPVSQETKPPEKFPRKLKPAPLPPPKTEEQKKADKKAKKQPKKAPFFAKSQVKEPKAKKKAAKMAKGGKAPKLSPLEQLAAATLELQEEPMETTKQRPTPEQKPTLETAATPYDIVANIVVEQAIAETMTGVQSQEAAVTVQAQPEAQGKPPSPPPVVLREKKKKKKSKEKKKKDRPPSYKEEAVISKQRGSRSLQTPDETVTVSFIPKPSNIKKSFPVTHQKLLTGEDLSSPDSSDNEEALRESYSTPGFEKLDSQNFEEFGLDIRDIDQIREEKEKEWKEDLDNASQGTESTLKEADHLDDETKERDDKVAQRLDFTTDGATTKDQAAASLLARWQKVHSLDKIDRLNTNKVNVPPTIPDTESVSSTDAFAIHRDRQSRDIYQFGSMVVYNKMPHDQERDTKDKRPSSVHKLVSQIESKKRRKNIPGDSTTEKPEDTPPQGVVRSGSVSEKLKMFGGGLKSTRPAPKPPQQRERESQPPSELQRKSSGKLSVSEPVMEKDEEVPSTVAGGPRIGEKVAKDTREETDGHPETTSKPVEVEKPQAITAVTDSRSETPQPTTDAQPTHTSPFGPISEEGSGETQDRVAPLPKINPKLGRRCSEERLRLDGLKFQSEGGESDGFARLKSTRHSPPPPPRQISSRHSPPPPPRQISSRHSPPVQPKGKAPPPPMTRILQTETTGPGPGVEAPIREKHSPGGKRKPASVYSPLVVSADAKSMQELKKEKHRSAPTPPHSAESLALYMNSANLPHLNHLKEMHEREERERAEMVVKALLEEPQCSGNKVPVEFRDIQPGARNKMYVWKQKAGSLHKVASVDAVTFDPKGLYIFLKVHAQGPLLHHVFLWVGGGVSDFAVHSAYQHCQRLVSCLPGRPVLHRESQGHESFQFASEIGGTLLASHDKAPQYLNTALSRAKLYRFESRTSSFPAVDSPLSPSLLTPHTPFILDTPLRVFLWLPAAHLKEREEKQSSTTLEIAKLFIRQHSYPNWTPVSIVTEQGETEEFSAHFPSWPHVPLPLAPQAPELNLPTTRSSSVVYPATGQTKVWQVKREEIQPVPQIRYGQFSSEEVYMVQYNYQKRSSLYVWMESIVYLWVGREVGRGEEGGWEAVVTRALRHVESISGGGPMPLMIVPEGKEPEQLLNFFKGRFIIRSSKISSGNIHLYQVQGNAAFRMKAIEVPATSSSLHSSHVFVLCVEGRVWVWSGQFSSQTERRGGLMIAKALGRASDPIKLAEGLEVPEFWVHLKGKARHQHFPTPEHAAHSLPTYYSVQVDRRSGTVTFRQKRPLSKQDLTSTECYLVAFKDQIIIWQGGQCKGTSAPVLIKSYTSQYHSWQSPSDFMTTVVCEASEGEMFWKWLNEMKNAGTKATPTQPMKEEVTPTQEVIDEATPTQEEEKGLDETDEGLQQPESADQPEVTLRGPPTSRSLNLTVSQVAAFDKVEQLQADIEAQMEQLAERGKEGGENVKEKRVSPFRTSQAVQELSDMIDGLDSMMENLRSHSLTSLDKQEREVKRKRRVSTSSPNVFEDSSPKRKPAGAEAQTGLGTKLTSEIEASTLSIPTPSIDDLLTQSEDNLPESPSLQKRRPTREAPKPPPTLLVMVEVEGGRVCEVRVRERAPVITVMFKVAQMTEVTLTMNSTIFEVCESLRIQRPLEDHELVRDVMATWPSKNRPKLLLRGFVTKTCLWGPDPPIAKHIITGYLKHNKVPDVTTQMLHSKRGSKLQWKEGNFCLRALGIYAITESKKGSRLELSAGLDHGLYTPITGQDKTISTPTPFCFIMKPVSSWKEKDLKLYCSPNLHSMAQWVHTIRLVKHGLQLKGNYIAMKNRLQKLQKS